MASLRGGGEEGEAWHRAGMLQHKQRVFDDLHTAAERLVDDGVTRPDMLLDMVRYELHGLGRLWSEEFGSAADPEQLRLLLTYSPYHRVRAGTVYPGVLFTVFDSDSRVDPLHARKMAAALQHATSADPAVRPVLMRLERDAGHGARSVSRAAASSADTLAFRAWATGLTADAVE